MSTPQRIIEQLSSADNSEKSAWQKEVNETRKILSLKAIDATLKKIQLQNSRSLPIGYPLISKVKKFCENIFYGNNSLFSNLLTVETTPADFSQNISTTILQLISKINIFKDGLSKYKASLLKEISIPNNLITEVENNFKELASNCCGKNICTNCQQKQQEITKKSSNLLNFLNDMQEDLENIEYIFKFIDELKNTLENNFTEQHDPMVIFYLANIDLDITDQFGAFDALVTEFEDAHNENLSKKWIDRTQKDLRELCNKFDQALLCAIAETCNHYTEKYGAYRQEFETFLSTSKNLDDELNKYANILPKNFKPYIIEVKQVLKNKAGLATMTIQNIDTLMAHLNEIQMAVNELNLSNIMDSTPENTNGEDISVGTTLKYQKM